MLFDVRPWQAIMPLEPAFLLCDASKSAKGGDMQGLLCTAEHMRTKALTK